MIPNLNRYKEKWNVKSDDIIKPGLAAIEEALVRVGNPENGLQVVHLAGTNGKGSTLTFLESLAKEHGLRVGKFMSPCIVDVHDQIQVEGQAITGAVMDQLFQQMQAAGLSEKLTDFELLTVAAFLHFAASDVDIALIEAGMGGLLDSTNVVTPIVSIIPSIALEHTKFLGTTIERITHHKAGIIKPYKPVIIGDLPQEAKDIIYKEAREKQSTVLELNQQFSVGQEKDGETYEYDKQSFHLSKLTRSMKGAHQANNMALAITAFLEVATALNIKVIKSALEKGVKEATILGRFEEILPHVILDGAHNPASVEKLIETIKSEFPDEQIALVIGILADKDVPQILQLFEQISDHFYFVDFNNPRAMGAQKMLELSGAPYKEVLVDYASFLQHQSERKLKTIVTGSLYLLTEVRNRLKSI
ncbi:bifunctional folylpolyglutamate synthase/dihydrofolate synthase [Lysinibacillus pakistanensis]|uniref:tetrahydrofolate synthase n=1 Tax=Lysinibacillus pakistanensis TaxID=759811 RepID=A0AAX3WV65_9BACI|nr:folylpolyglutamate synthase/dihydrofolate synthase family protein [Lysinibacillus pakistanensis]MDM5229684.1 folylpolyglutamate synthase/dihydrofolate synthase family protein [Lysinibacillus pakistanensis]WHY45294.1 folylpolyglutamate synthase/dihydrofolate synthase family protein [Lysinibacillus pakistanensis]WHY50302.1 folylpolyglutamate synthase/dihydrofolate synthase family protein [Lysinibacillus pakistanensis]